MPRGPRPSLAPALALALVLAVALPSASAAVRTTWRAEDAEALGLRLLEDPAWREAADRRAPFAFEIAVVGRDPVRYVYDGELRAHDADPEVVLAMTADAALVVLNAEGPRGAIRCLVDDGAIVAKPRDAGARVALQAYRARLDATCEAPARDRWIFDGYGSPLGWQDLDAVAKLGRPDAGVSRLAPDELERPTEAPDLADPWRAPLALAPLLARAMDCPCASSASLVPAGDWRAALEADPRTEARG